MINLIHIGMYGGLTTPWSTSNNKKNIDFLLSFDPLYNKKCVRERRRIQGDHVKKAVFDTDGDRKFYVLKKPQCSSLYEPNYPFIEQYYGEIADKYVLKEIRTVSCVRLDTVLKGYKKNFDFMCTDTQGADCAIIKSAGHFLDDMVGLHLELYLRPFYKDAELFEEADRYLQSRGFYVAKKLRENPKLYDNFVYLNKNTKKYKKLDWVKKIYGINQ